MAKASVDDTVGGEQAPRSIPATPLSASRMVTTRLTTAVDVASLVETVSFAGV